jgi:hypothetical protein
MRLLLGLLLAILIVLFASALIIIFPPIGVPMLFLMLFVVYQIAKEKG